MSRRRLETQLLHFDGTMWRGYSYAWNDEQTDAVLVPAAGMDRTMTVIDPHAPGGKRKQIWHFPSRTECLTCHNPWAGHTLAFTLPQLSRDHAYGAVIDNQVEALKHAGLIELVRAPEAGAAPFQMPARLSNPHDTAAGINERARSYLHVNCAHCHRFGGGGTADLELRYGPALEEMKTLEVRPTQGAFEIPGAHILSPGDPYRSVLYYRMAKIGRGRMPHIGSEIVDERGLRLIHDWIRQLPVRKDERLLVERLRGSNDAASGKGAAERAEIITRLLSSTSGALMLADAVGEGRLPGPVRSEVVAAAVARTEPQVRDLFERFIPDEQRVKRLGSVIRPEQVLSLKGDAVRGRELFFKSAGLQCVNCHKINGTGSNLGPDLSQIGKKLTRTQVLDNLLEPSKTIDPLYVPYLLETTDGKFHTGLLAERNDREVVLKIAGDKEVRVPASKVERLAPQSKSLMPELLLRDLTAEQAADLVEFLASLK
jgi:putative heme-binding domain-containing protein